MIISERQIVVDCRNSALVSTCPGVEWPCCTADEGHWTPFRGSRVVVHVTSCLKCLPTPWSREFDSTSRNLVLVSAITNTSECLVPQKMKPCLSHLKRLVQSVFHFKAILFHCVRIVNICCFQTQNLEDSSSLLLQFYPQIRQNFLSSNY